MRASTRVAADPPAALPACLPAALPACLVSALLACLAPATADAQSLIRDPEPPTEVTLPDPMPGVPPAEQTIGFYVSPTTTNRFAVDPRSIGIDGGKVVRFTLIVTSRSGVRNVSYEAFACDRAEQRLLAIARSDGSWSVLRDSRWRPLNIDDTVNRQMPELYRRFCAGGAAAGTTPKALVARLHSEPGIVNN